MSKWPRAKIICQYVQLSCILSMLFQDSFLNYTEKLLGFFRFTQKTFSFCQIVQRTAFIFTIHFHMIILFKLPDSAFFTFYVDLQKYLFYLPLAIFQVFMHMTFNYLYAIQNMLLCHFWHTFIFLEFFLQAFWNKKINKNIYCIAVQNLDLDKIQDPNQSP
jgi:hypothetical protein